MCKRVLLAFAVSVFCGQVGVTSATVLRDAASELPSSFSYATREYGSGFVKNPATAGLVESTEIFGLISVRAISFENAAAEGAARPTGKTRAASLEELIVIASLSPGYDLAPVQSLHETGTAGTLGGVRTQQELETTKIRDLAKILVNRPRPLDGTTDRNAPAEAGPGGGGGFSFIDAALELELDQEFVEIVTHVVTPSVTLEGIVALNFLGIRDFAFLVSPETNKIQVVDFQTGATVTVSNSVYEQPKVKPGERNQSTERRVQRQTTERRLTFVRVLVGIKKFMTNPLVIGSVVLTVIFTIVFRIARRAAG